jgi:hypothetical protein
LALLLGVKEQKNEKNNKKDERDRKSIDNYS